MFNLSSLPRTLAAAERDVTHSKFEVRLSAVRDLSRLSRSDELRAPALRVLQTALSEDKAPGIRAEAAVALADAKAEECLAALIDASKDTHDRVRQMALMALGELGASNPEALGVVEAAIDDPKPELRFQALVAWHHLNPDFDPDRLLRRMIDEDAHIRYVALRIAEERWVEKATVLAETPSEALPETPSEALPETPSEALPETLSEALPETIIVAARRSLNDSAPEVRLAAAILLARAGVQVTEKPLVDAVNSGLGAKEPEDEQSAIELCGVHRLTKARRGLVRRAFGWFGVSRDAFAWQARVALAKMGDRRAVESILRGLSGWTRDTRTLAVAAAGSARLLEARPSIEAMRGKESSADQGAVTQALAELDACATS